MKVLVADDSGVIRCVIKRALYELGVDDIDEVANGSEGICMVKNERYDLIITDWNMPHHSGIELVKAARAEGLSCPIIMQTTESQKPLVLQAIAAGVNDYVLKPFTKEYMIERLERFVVSVRAKLSVAAAPEAENVI